MLVGAIYLTSHFVSLPRINMLSQLLTTECSLHARVLFTRNNIINRLSKFFFFCWRISPRGVYLFCFNCTFIESCTPCNAGCPKKGVSKTTSHNMTPSITIATIALLEWIAVLKRSVSSILNKKRIKNCVSGIGVQLKETHWFLVLCLW